MDYVFEKEWKETVAEISKNFGEELEYSAILVLIGFQELNMEYRAFKKDEKISLMHIAVCTLLEPYGYYTFVGRDEQGWPHFERTHLLPNLAADDQELLIRKAIINYLKKDD